MALILLIASTAMVALLVLLGVIAFRDQGQVTARALIASARTLSPERLLRRELAGPAPGSVHEPWARACQRLGIEYVLAEETLARAAIRYSQAVWNNLHGPDASAPPVSQRLAITVILGDAGLRQAVTAWDQALWSTPIRLQDVILERDEVFTRVADSLSSQVRLQGRQDR